MEDNDAPRSYSMDDLDKIAPVPADKKPAPPKPKVFIAESAPVARSAPAKPKPSSGPMLIECPACAEMVSNQAKACPHCAQPIRVFKGPPHECSQCGGKLAAEKKATSEGSGCIVAILGLVLAPFILGIPLIIYGLHLMSKREANWRCKSCEATFPRKVRWYEFG